MIRITSLTRRHDRSICRWLFINQQGLHGVRSIHDLISDFHKDFFFVPDFISPAEENDLLSAVNVSLKRKKYEGNHWDSVISQYKEIEINESKLNSEAVSILSKCRKFIDFKIEKSVKYLPVHAIDLADDGMIYPHVDSVKFSGELIAGLSLLSDRILFLQPADADSPTDNDNQVWNQDETVKSPYQYSYALAVPRRSIYILKGPLRYSYAHSILGKSSEFISAPDSVSIVPELPNLSISRRVSVMFRDAHPNDNST